MVPLRNYSQTQVAVAFCQIVVSKKGSFMKIPSKNQDLIIHEQKKKKQTNKRTKLPTHKISYWNS